MKTRHGLLGIAYQLIRGAVRLLAAFPLSRSALNVIYLALTPRLQAAFHAGFAKIFRGKGVELRDGFWEVAFAGQKIRIPLSRNSSWLDWDTALSIIGHDVEVKQTYQQLVESPEAPELFIDVGANYGTHSLLFLALKIESLTFEPNSACHEYFESICRANAVKPRVEKVALGASNTTIELSYPEKDTWLGSTDPSVAAALRADYEVKTTLVKQRTLDEYVDLMTAGRTLIKIDTEGNELSVLQGARRTLEEVQPRIIFECWANPERGKVFDFLHQHKYGIAQLPWTPRMDSRTLTLNEFLASRLKNFMALPLQVQ